MKSIATILGVLFIAGTALGQNHETIEFTQPLAVTPSDTFTANQANSEFDLPAKIYELPAGASEELKLQKAALDLAQKNYDEHMAKVATAINTATWAEGDNTKASSEQLSKLKALLQAAKEKRAKLLAIEVEFDQQKDAFLADKGSQDQVIGMRTP